MRWLRTASRQVSQSVIGVRPVSRVRVLAAGMRDAAVTAGIPGAPIVVTSHQNGQSQSPAQVSQCDFPVDNPLAGPASAICQVIPQPGSNHRVLPATSTDGQPAQKVRASVTGQGPFGDNYLHASDGGRAGQRLDLDEPLVVDPQISRTVRQSSADKS
jgi:hypothetical protein